MVEILLNLFTGFAIGMGVGFGLALALIKKNTEQELSDYYQAGYETGLRRSEFKNRQKERNRIIEILENHKLLPTYSKAASEFAEETWDNTKYRLIQEIKKEVNA